jgi:predicted DNA-binding transcriptional regulator YafY
MLEIVTLLLGGKALTAGALAARFEVSVRTIYRDVEAISAAGIPVYMTKGRGGGIALTPGYALGKALLTEGERADVLASLKALGGVAPGESDGALKKLGALFGTAAADWIEVDFSAWSDPPGVAEAFSRIKSAILGRRVVRFQYSSGKGETALRTVEPLKLYFKGQAWYLYGFCRDRQDTRFFKLSRIRNLTEMEETFSRECPDTVPAAYPLSRGEAVEVALRLPAAQAFRVYDEFERPELLPDGSFLVRASLTRGEGLFHYILSFGEHAEVLEPPEVRSEITEKLKKILSRYQI